MYPYSFPCGPLSYLSRDPPVAQSSVAYVKCFVHNVPVCAVFASSLYVTSPQSFLNCRDKIVLDVEQRPLFCPFLTLTMNSRHHFGTISAVIV